MKKVIGSLVVLGLVLGVGVFFLRDRMSPKTGVYQWSGVWIEALPSTPGKGAEWSGLSVSDEEIFSRDPNLRAGPAANDDRGILKQADEGQRYFRLLFTALSLLSEKYILEESRRQGLTAQDWIQKNLPAVDFEQEMEKWYRENGVSPADLIDTQKQVVFSAIQSQAQRKLTLSKMGEGRTPVRFYFLPPSEEVQWDYSGLPLQSGAGSHSRIMLFCDTTSAGCVKALRVFGDLEDQASIHFHPIRVPGDIMSDVRAKILGCLLDLEPTHVSSALKAFISAKNETTENELYQLSESKNVSALRTCVVSPEAEADLKKTEALLAQLEGAAPPVSLVEGELIVGPISRDRVSEILARRSRK